MIDQGGDWGSGYGYGYDDSNGNGHCTTNGNANTNGGDVAHGKSVEIPLTMAMPM